MNVECSSCSVDVRALGQDSPLYVTLCGHICCVVCRDNWFGKDRETCPRCRKPQTRSALIRLYYDLSDSEAANSFSSSSNALQPVYAEEENVSKEVVDEACTNFIKGFAKEEEDYLSRANRANELIDVISQSTLSHGLRRPLKLIQSTLRELSFKFSTLQQDHNLMSKHYASQADAELQLTRLQGETKLKDELLQQRQYEMETNEALWKQRVSKLFVEMDETRARLEIQSSELAAKCGESARLQHNNLELKKKYHALKQKISQAKHRRMDGIDDSLVII